MQSRMFTPVVTTLQQVLPTQQGQQEQHKAWLEQCNTDPPPPPPAQYAQLRRRHALNATPLEGLRLCGMLLAQRTAD